MSISRSSFRARRRRKKTIITLSLSTVPTTMDESAPPVKSFLSEALNAASECEPEMPLTPEAAANLQPSSSSSLNSSEVILAASASTRFALSDLPDDLLLKILMLVDEPTRQFAVHGVSQRGGEIRVLRSFVEISSTPYADSPFFFHSTSTSKKKKTSSQPRPQKPSLRSAAPGALSRPAPRPSPSSTRTSSSTDLLWRPPRTPRPEGSWGASGSDSEDAAAAGAGPLRASPVVASPLGRALAARRCFLLPEEETITLRRTAGAAGGAWARAATSPPRSSAVARRRRRARGCSC